jgi:hypothetical protein
MQCPKCRSTAIRMELGSRVRHRTNCYLNNRLEQDHRGVKGDVDRCSASRASHQQDDIAAVTTNSGTSSAPDLACANMFPPLHGALKPREVRSVGSIAGWGNTDAMDLRLIAAGDNARRLNTDLLETANLGLTLPEAKQLLASVQRAVVSGQVDSHALQRPSCRSCSGSLNRTFGVTPVMHLPFRAARRARRTRSRRRVRSG